jgi:selenocysteine lyase/cysteine desulfurase
MVCITHIPTNSGIVNPVEEIGQKISKFNTEQSKLSEPQILYLVDACQVRCWDAFTFTKLFANDASLISFLLHFSEVCGTGFR